MKDQEFFERAAGWVTVPLSEAALIGAGNSAPQKKELFESGRHPFIRTSDVGQIGFGEIGEARDLLNDAGVAKLRRVTSGAILMPKSGASTFLNHRVQTTVDAYVSSHLATIEARKKKALPRYLLYYLSTVKAQDLIQDHKYPSLTLGVIGNIPIPLPPLEEQKRIVAVLDQAFAALDRARAHAEANIASADDLFGSILDATLAMDTDGWSRYALRSLGKVQTGSTPKTSEPQNYGAHLPFIKPGDFRSDGSLVLDNEGLSETGAAKARRVPAGSALMVCIGATIGKAGFTDAEIATNQQINSITPKEGVSGEFLYYQFITPKFQREVTKRSGQATLPIVNKSKWSEIEVAMPQDKDAQLQVVDRLRTARRHTEHLIAAYQERLSDISNLRQSFLQQAFTGRLT